MCLAQDAGRFAAEIAPVTIIEKRKEVQVTVDEHPRPQTTIEGLNKLPTLFKKNGLVTAGTASVRNVTVYYLTNICQTFPFVNTCIVVNMKVYVLKFI